MKVQGPWMSIGDAQESKAPKAKYTNLLLADLTCGLYFLLEGSMDRFVFFFWFLEFESLNPKYAVFFCGMNGPTIRKTLAPPLLFGATHFVWGCVEGPGCVKEFSTLNETNARCYLVCFLRKGISYGSSSQTFSTFACYFSPKQTMERNLRGLLKFSR